MKIFKKISSSILTIFIVLMAIISLSGIITRRSNYGVPSFFSQSILVVLTDSMEPTLKQGTGIIIKKVPLETLRAKDDNYEGDIITYYRPSQGIVVTHRLYDIIDNNGVKSYVVFGDNPYASSCNGVCDYDTQKEIINGKYIIGKVIKENYTIGKVYSFISKNQIFIFLVPLTILISISFIEKIKEKDKEEADEK